MPSRNIDSHETASASDSRRDSLRRLSSLASLQALNPFARRRSHNTENSLAASSSSNLSLASTLNNNAPQIHQMAASSSSHLLPDADELTALPIPPVPTHASSRRSSYICMPDDPIGGMLRSRTFSNLPIPSRARRNTTMVGSKSHSRLPSVAQPPPTRIPTPPISSRRHSNTRLTPLQAAPKQSFVRRKMQRSDTEPLLPVNLGRTTAFKENISLSPVKPLPAMFDNKDLYGSSLPSRAYAERHAWTDNSEASPPSHRRQQSLAAATLTQSSPAYRSARERQPTPAKPEPLQRWSSQPVLSNVTNRQASRHGEIAERRLLSAVSIPAAPPPKPTMTSSGLAEMRDAAGPPRPAPPPSTTPSQPAFARNAPSPPPKNQQISAREPPAYWCGRFSALHDRFRTEELATHIHSPKTQSDKMHAPEANTKRMRHVLEYLYAMCVTPEARESFVVFQLQFAALHQGNMAGDLGRPMQLSVLEKRIVLGRRRESCGVEEGEEGGGDMRAMSERRERSFMDRLLGRGRKHLV